MFIQYVGATDLHRSTVGQSVSDNVIRAGRKPVEVDSGWVIAGQERVVKTARFYTAESILGLAAKPTETNGIAAILLIEGSHSTVWDVNESISSCTPASKQAVYYQRLANAVWHYRFPECLYISTFRANDFENSASGKSLMSWVKSKNIDLPNEFILIGYSNHQQGDFGRIEFFVPLSSFGLSTNFTQDDLQKQGVIEWAQQLIAPGKNFSAQKRVVQPLPLVPTAKPVNQLANISAVPFIRDSGRQGYQEFLSKPTPRAFALGQNGAWGWATGENAQARAMASCARNASDCVLYAVDNNIVWTPPKTSTPQEGGGK
ncbi:hypothetical protein [Parvibium lacunae]|uniref:hypothetical protein n=1 Tax=Parvibium lacunae TaxID=1888893 RepID=UPI0011C01D53|nr:hypothetical protein [Parvibium lacunae]